jgi:Tfp pilus assembly protein PilZ
MNTKDHLKKIIHERLDKTASTLFINNTLEIINGSADSKESFLSAADRISKRIALFIDVDLARELFDILKMEIGKISSPSGTRRKHARVIVSNKVYVTYDRKTHELYTRNLSERGMYIKTKDPFPVGMEVEIMLPLEMEGDIHMKGVVVHIKPPFGETSMHPSGMGIAFKEIKDDVQIALRNFIKRAQLQETS